MKHERRAKDKLRDIGVRPSKLRGQNFLVNEDALDSIIEFGKPSSDERIIEIGPGLGALTKRLVPVGLAVAVEIEGEFCTYLREHYPGLHVVQEDFCKANLADLGSDLTLFGNLPYSRSTDILTHVLDNASLVRRGVFLLQKEFAERVAAKPGKRDYGTLSIGVQLKAEVSLGPIIAGDQFHPPTAVSSRVIELRFPRPAPFEVDDPKWVRRVVKAAFSQRRRTVLNSLRGSGFFTHENIDGALAAARVDPGRRAETISVSDFLVIATHLKSKT